MQSTISFLSFCALLQTHIHTNQNPRVKTLGIFSRLYWWVRQKSYFNFDNAPKKNEYQQQASYKQIERFFFYPLLLHKEQETE